MLAWGCVYQCHRGHNPEQATFGTGSLFSIRRVVAEHFQFDTNIRYFKTFGCEEHDFSRRLKKISIKLAQASAAKANHYHAPAKDRAWRGLGGDLNYLYERTKKGSILRYYSSLSMGIIYAIQKLLKFSPQEPDTNRSYKQAFYAFHRVFSLVRDKKILVSGKYLFFVIFDIPIRALIQRKIEEKQSNKLLNAISRHN